MLQVAAGILICAARAAYPGPEYLHPKLHYSSEPLHTGGWHDVAGAITLGTGEDAAHHVFMGTGWHHAMSRDLVHWEDLGMGPRKIREEHAGLLSESDPCSGYVTVDDDGSVCAGFRQCGSQQGVHGGAAWDVPLELRCAKDANLTEWGEPIWLFDVFFYRPIPYDPARPWKEDGRWYQIVSTDACNDTTRVSPCAEGGRLDLWSSPTLKTTEWQFHGPIFTSNKTVIPSGHLTKEMVTIDYLGNLPGDPQGADSHTRFFFNNVGGNGGGEGCCSGTTAYLKVKQRKDEPFEVDYEDPHSMGMVDWGSFTPVDVNATTKGIEGLRGDASRAYSMARTLGGDVNQVTGGGRRVMLAWTGTTPASMSIARDLSVNDDYELLQQFVPEMNILRKQETTSGGQQLEVFAKFQVPGGSELPPSPSPAPDKAWTPVVSKGYYGKVDIGSAAFRQALSVSPTGIVRRLCAACTGTHRTIYYKRRTPVPANIDLLEVLKSNWTDYENVLNVDFELYSDYAAALEGRTADAWQYCNFNDVTGAFRDCGPSQSVVYQWNTFDLSHCTAGEGQGNVAFHVDATGPGTDWTPPAPPALLPFGIEVLTGSNGESTHIGVDPIRGLVVVDGRSQGNPDIRAGPLMPSNATEVSIHAIIDHSIIEVIVNNRTALTVYVTPSSAESTGVAIYGTGDGTNMGKVTGSLQVWELESANNLNEGPLVI